MDPVHSTLQHLWHSSSVPKLVLEMSFTFLIRRIDWFQPFNETVLYSLLFAFASNSVLSAGYLLFSECCLMAAVYWNPYKLIGNLCPDFIASIIPEPILQFTEETLKIIDLTLVEFLWRFRHEDFGYQRHFRFAHKTLLFLFTRYTILAPPCLVTICYIFIVVYNYVFNFQIKTVHDILLLIILSIIGVSSLIHTIRLYMYFYSFTCFFLTLAWFSYKFPYMVLHADADYVYMIEL